MRRLFAVRTPSPSMAVALTALFIALGGTGYAMASLPNNSVGTPQLKNNAVTTPKIKNGAVTPAKIKASTITVIAKGTANAGSWGLAQANCPSGFQAVSGGVDPGNVQTEYVTGSEPVINHSSRFGSLAAGTYGPATGWIAYVFNTTGSPQSVAVAAVCSRIG